MSNYINQLANSDLLDSVTKSFLRNAMPDTPDIGKIGTLKHIWQIHDFLLCPIIGTCLSLSEQKQILKKTGTPVKEMGEYDIHSRLVQLAGTENHTSIRIEATLNRKYRKEMKTYFKIFKEELLSVWKTQFAAGDYVALLWSASVRPDLSEEVVCEILADIHMQMHTLSEQRRRDRQTLHRLENENRKLSLRIKELKKTYREVVKANRLLKDERSGAHRKCAFLENERLRLIEQSENTPDWHHEVTTLKRENEVLCSELENLVESFRFLQQAYDALEADNFALRRKPASVESDDLPRPAATFASKCPAERKCPAYSLCHHRVLIVGGITKMEALYRKFVETCGGTFEYHDGYMQAGKSDLENKVRRADLVLCPVNCNSHGACLMAKRLGKKYGKTVRMLAGSSLSSISQSLWKYEKDHLHEKRLTH